jgi:hypothetical protein
VSRLPLSLTASLVAFSLVSVAGAADVSAKLVGKWKIKDIKVEANSKGADKAKTMLQSTTIEFTKDKKFSMMMVFPLKGTWTVKGNLVQMRMTEMMGMTIAQLKEMAKKSAASNPAMASPESLKKLDEPMNSTLSADGKTLTTKPEGSHNVLIFVKG